MYVCVCVWRERERERETERVQKNYRHSFHVQLIANLHLPLSQHGQVLTECSRMLLNVPVVLPSYFFIALQRTTVKVHI